MRYKEEAMALDEAQQAAVNHYNGPAMILAGPGSGKTTVITGRVKRLICEYGVSPDKILVITFTKKAALEMKSRYLRLAGERETEVTFGTFHAVFFMILRNVSGYKSEDIVKTSEQRDFVSMYLKAKGVGVRDLQAFVGDVISELAKVKTCKAADEYLDNYIPSSCEAELFKELYKEYENMLKSEHKVDFEDMLMAAYKLLNGRPDVLKMWQKRYEYVLIDEFQDSCEVQFDIVKMLCAAHQNIFVVGDDDQSIYGFRGAFPAVMKSFKEFYREAAVYRLNINYRCAGAIVKAATAVINKNNQRFFKNLRAYNDMGAQIEVIEFKDIKEQQIYIAEAIEKMMSLSHTDKANIAVLTRTNSGGSGIAKRLMRRDVEVDYKEKRGSVFGHWIADDIKAFFRIALGENNRIDYIRIINKPPRQISRMFFTDERVDCAKVADNMRRAGQYELVWEFSLLTEDLQYASGLNAYGAFTYIRRKIGYELYLRQYAISNGIDEAKLIKTLDELQATTINCVNIKQWLELAESSCIVAGNLEKGISAGSVNSSENMKNMGNAKTPPVQDSIKHTSEITFLTMHSAKGLEFDTVFIPDVNEGIVPYDKAISEEAIEEERRLFYVAMTRAKKKLIICYTKEHYNRYVQPSRFLKELRGCRNVKFYSYPLNTH